MSTNSNTRTKIASDLRQKAIQEIIKEIYNNAIKIAAKGEDCYLFPFTADEQFVHDVRISLIEHGFYICGIDSVQGKRLQYRLYYSWIKMINE